MAHHFLDGLRSLTKGLDELTAEEVRPLLHKYFAERTDMLARSMQKHCDAIVRMVCQTKEKQCPHPSNLK
jgi:hypothetical protein